MATLRFHNIYNHSTITPKLLIIKRLDAASVLFSNLLDFYGVFHKLKGRISEHSSDMNELGKTAAKKGGDVETGIIKADHIQSFIMGRINYWI